ncbi:hypothetical protein [Paenibacillus hexagrammi]|uniref:Uncharacterized protein n=1 Tax=Paenibacillus hexagrammi TaxID=2908839 RepID=A0ABY3STH2_9BACL|nr:hypothetical protein [Paenibacillus sp. YPD9-1]UJF36549.1 hypothetical protein L0M14_30645 [Paenibacillus sp. YPD9-1]
MRKQWEEMTIVERAIANEKFMIKRIGEAAQALRDMNNYVPAIILEEKIREKQYYLDELESGKHDWMNKAGVNDDPSLEETA